MVQKAIRDFNVIPKRKSNVIPVLVFGRNQPAYARLVWVQECSLKLTLAKNYLNALYINSQILV